eukprot:CAMPEP_0181313352 /NCGR_PEP_ID=MMETSP1101-20121128/14202_1 /TAXON_ID=46948 /ORGANISM="Rhodomonas abbreviata, Strain Caron Lab Isolate" /LENGTH=445 /DNA_ID=CAMNT_0023420299 /DNA_START=21 /DNA_END=1358 /DNA_ORIENTATION=-
MSVEEPSAATAPQAINYEELDFDQKMKIYYGRVFPYDAMYQWLSYGKHDKDSATSDSFTRREICFTLANDVYIRYLSYPSAEAWREDMIKKIPHKIDIGAIYSAEPKQKTYLSKDAFKEVSREFVLDIDLTDYQEDGTIASNCIDPSNPEFKKSWRFMALAVKVLDKALRDDFGFKHLLWVFSGRRGIHCWVADERARFMSNAARTAVADYLNIFKGGEKEKTQIPALHTPLHPSLERALDVLKGLEDDEFNFETLLEEQEWLQEGTHLNKTLELIGDEELRAEILEKLQRMPKSSTAQDRWAKMQDVIRKPRNEESKKRRGKRGEQSGEDIIMHLIFKLTYPRLDINVSKMMNHLLKSPFCVHPKTHRICVPLDPLKIDEFDPTEVPSLEDALRNLDSVATAKKGYKTSLMDSYVRTFKDTFLKGLVEESMAKKRKAQDASMAF